jgi:hypothetical protein
LNWESFFETLAKRFQPLKKESAVTVFKLSNDPELMTLMLKDSKIRHHISKAEGLRVVIENQNIPAVKRRLTELGYCSI